MKKLFTLLSCLMMAVYVWGDTYTVTFNNNVGASGTVPAAIEVEAGQSITIPTNQTLYVEGKTLTKWDDGAAQYAQGASYTPTSNVTLTPVFEGNSKSVADFPKDKFVTWYFGKSNGAVTYTGTANCNVVQVAVDGENTIDVAAVMAGGENVGRGDEWLNTQNKNISIPVIDGATIEVKQYYCEEITINGEEIAYDSKYGPVGNVVYTYKYSGAAGMVDVKATHYLSYIKVNYPGAVRPWGNFKSFAAVLNDNTLLTTEETTNKTPFTFGVASDGTTTSRVAVDADDCIATISGTYNNGHGCGYLSVQVPVPGPVKIIVGTCSFSNSNVTVTNLEGEKIIVTPASNANFKNDNSYCWMNSHSNVTEIYYTGEPSIITITGMSYCPYVAVESIDNSLTVRTNAGSWTSFTPPYNCTIESGATPYIITEIAGEGSSFTSITGNPVSVMKAGEGYFIKGAESNHEYTVTQSDEDADDVTGSILVGCPATKLLASNDGSRNYEYFLGTKSAVAGLYYVGTDGLIMPAGKCYLQSASTSALNNIMLPFDNVTAVQNVEAAPVANDAQVGQKAFINGHLVILTENGFVNALGQGVK